MDDPLRGYIEGYYGRLLTWQDRQRLIESVANNGFNCYFYAPKEDAAHRLRWREPYDAIWCAAFNALCAAASERQVQVIAGIAPGLDFNFSTGGNLRNTADFKLLADKAVLLLSEGATHIGLLMDDINPALNMRGTNFDSEGQAHATLANALADHLQRPVFVVPRVYAGELSADSPDYADRFSSTLDTANPVFHCGTHIVSESIATDHFADYVHNDKSRIIIWDNLYANDYCPRKLYVGPWTGRDGVEEVLLNPTGMPATDAMLLDIMSACATAQDTQSAWQRCLSKHGVPDAFFTISCYFNHPPFTFSDDEARQAELLDHSGCPLAEQIDAIDTLLWTWKSSMSREWYPYLFGLKHDLLYAHGQHRPDRIAKTQLQPLAVALLMPRKFMN